MEWLSSPEIWVAFLTLTALEIVLGIDNIIFISILVGRLPKEQQPKARFFGLALAMGTRILLLLSIAWVMRLTNDLFTVFEHGVSGRDLILFFGGLFWGLGFYFVSPYQIGLLAAIDRRGRAAVAAGGIMNFGYALGPSIAGRTLQSLDADALLIVIVGTTALSMFLLLPLAMRLERGARERAGDAQMGELLPEESL